ncbi:MAG: hypothetical protein ABID54_01280 [Pseudomonadota bacterium]
MFFIDDLILRSLGFSLGPFDLFYLLEIVVDYTRELYIEEQIKGLRNRLKEYRLLFELMEITYEEYTRINDELTRKLMEFLKVKRIRLSERVNLIP